MTRDFDKNPYSLEEGRVCDYLQKLAPDIGCGDDPIGFLIASHAALGIDNARRVEVLKEIENWLLRKPTEGGRVYGHGSGPMLDLVRKALAR